MFKKFSIRIKLILFSIVILSVFMSSSTYFTIQYFKEEVSDIFQKETAEKVAFLNIYLENYLATPIGLVNKTAEQVQLFDSIEEKEKLLENLKIKADGVEGALGLHVAFEGDRNLYSSTKTNYDSEFNSNERTWYIQAMNQPNEVVVTTPYIDALTGKLIVGVSKALANNKGVVTLDLDLAFLEDVMSSISIGENGYSFIFDGEGKVLYHPTMEQSTSLKEVSYYDDFMKENFIEVNQNGEKVFLNHFHNELMNWEIGSLYTYEEVVSTYKPIVWKTISLNIASILVMAAFFYLIIHQLLKPLNKVVHTVNKVAEGNLKEVVEVKTEDEIGQLSISFNQMTHGLKSMIHQVDDTASKLNDFSTEVSSNVEENMQSIVQVVHNIQTVSDEIREQVDTAEYVKKTVQEMDNQIMNIANNVEEVNEVSVNAEGKTTLGVSVMQQALSQMNLIEGNAKQTTDNFNTLVSVANEISNFSKVISGIADQTNLLALNASIEAARAGEHGKGFAVVADEVRKLAEQTSESAKEIQSLIQSIQKTGEIANASIESNNRVVADGMNQINEASHVFNIINEQMGLLANKVIATKEALGILQIQKQEALISTNEIVKASQQVSGNIEQVAVAAEQQNVSMEQMAVSAQNLTEQAQVLRKSIQQFEI